MEKPKALNMVSNKALNKVLSRKNSKISIISMLEFGVTKEQILTRYSKEDLEKAEAAIAYK